MDIRDLAPALLALGDVLEEANRTINGDRCKISISVDASFRAGSFGMELVIGSLLHNTIDFLTGNPVTAALNLLGLLGFTSQAQKGVVQLIKWVRGRKISRVELLDNGNVKIFIDDQSEEVDKRVVDLFRNYKLRQALEKAISKPLEQEGITDFAVSTDGGKTFERVTKNEQIYFVAPVLEDEEITDSVVGKTLQLVSLSFKEDNKWRFTDGASTFFATIADQAFLDQVDKSESSFSKGDTLSVELRVKQWMSGEELKTEYIVEKVLEHKSGNRQISLPFSR